MAMDEVVLVGVKVALDKERTLKYLNKGFRALVETYGNMSNAIGALRAITPEKTAVKGEEKADGTIAEKDEYKDIEQNAVFYQTIVEWVFAGVVWEDRALTREIISDSIDDMSLYNLLDLRVAIWEAYGNSIVRPKADDEDPTKKTAP